MNNVAIIYDYDDDDERIRNENIKWNRDLLNLKY